MIRKIVGLVMLSTLSLTTAAFADEAADGHPCKDVAMACKSAGYVKGGAKDGKGLRKDCMHPILSGKSVEGVSVSADAVAACKARIAEHHRS